MKEKKARVEDALHATRAAVEEGIVPGGGVALLRGGEGSGGPEAGRRRADRRGHRAARLRRAAAPDRAERRLRRRRRRREGSRRTSNPTSASTPRPRCIEDLVKAGVIDPTKVARTALQNASSIASLMLTTEALICEIPEKKRASPCPAATAARHGLLKKVSTAVQLMGQASARPFFFVATSSSSIFFHEDHSAVRSLTGSPRAPGTETQAAR